MKQAISKKLSAVIAITMLFVLVLNLFLQIEDTQDTMERSALLMIERIEEILRSNDEDTLRLTESLKEEYIVRARAAAYMVGNHPELEHDSVSMRRIAELLQVDEICLFDETGTLYAGSHPEYYGLTFYDGEQISFFLPMLEDTTMALCQDVMPNTSLGRPMMYAAVWRDDGRGIVQVGLKPQRILEAMEKNDIGYIFSNLAIQEGVIGFAVSADTGEIVGSTKADFSGTNAADIRLVIPVGYQESFIARIDGVLSRCLFVQHGDLLLGVSWEYEVMYRDLGQSMLLVLLYLAVAAFIMLIAIKRNLDVLVINNIDTLNDRLEDITAGKLETKVDVSELPEFVSLSSHINRMVDSITNHSVKISRILDASESQIGFFEYSNESQIVLATRKVATILAISPEEMESLCREKELFEKRLAEIASAPVQRYKNVYELATETACYVKIETYVDENSTFGVVMDVTEEFVERLRLRHERDHDLLTQLNTRRAFYRQLGDLFDMPDQLGHAVMLMCDLDGLKGINDTYGHAGGDKAIRESANILTGIDIPNKIVARLSGDEFAVFIYGADGREQLQEHIDAMCRNMLCAEITVFDRTVPVRLSGGYVFYPEHCGGYTDLLRMADQALYYSKGAGRARFTEYDEACARQGDLREDVQGK